MSATGSFRVQELARVALFAALTAVSAQFSVNNPFVNVPFTLQVFAVLLSGTLLGPRLGFWAQVVYLLLGAVGLPVFAHFTGGIGHLFGLTGGFLLSYPLAAAAAGLWSQKRSVLGLSVGCLVGILLIYALGVAGMNLFGGVPLAKGSLGMLTFLPWDLFKAGLVVALSLKLQPLLRTAAA